MTKKNVKSGSKSGWCITGHHDQCPYRFTEWLCTCDCHREDSNDI